MHTLGIHHVAVQVHDVERAVRFYREALGLPEIERHHRDDGSLRSVWMGLEGGGFLAIEQTDRLPVHSSFRDESPGWLLVALRIPAGKRAAIEAHLAAHGVQVVHRTRWTLYVRDPEGNRIGLSHHPVDVP